ncbi:MAG: ABC transporter ATP-binding protein [Candidatus Bathyarchaeia archaeon]
MSLLQVENLTMRYATLRGWVQAVEGINFGINKGDSIGLAGESGCGKTSAALTILRLLPRNARVFSGAINFDGTDLLKLSERKFRQEIRWKRISTIFQGAMNSLHPTMRIGDQIVESITIHEKISKKEAIKRAKELLDLVGIGASRIDRYPHELSGGMKQRTVIAMSLACNPDLIIADEPTTALDVIIADQVLKVMKDLQTKLGLSMIVISHDLSMIAEVCNKIAIMYAGKIVELGDTVPIYKEPLHPYTQKLISAFPSVLGEKRELSSIHGFPPDLLNPPSGCRFHPRCEYAMPICQKEEPPTVTAGKEHYVACHLVGR